MRAKYDQFFKDEAVKLALSSPKSYAQTARELGITESNIYLWISHYKNKATESKVVKGEADLLAENRRLQQEVMRLKEERDILKKAAKFFANESK